MTVEDLRYPVLCFSQHLARVSQTADALTTCSNLALRKGGYYENLLVVDSAGVGLRIKGTEKVRGVGPFWGYNIFLNQRVKVRPHIDGAPIQASLAEVKRYVLDSFDRWHGWSTRGDFEELKTSVKAATSIPEIIERLS
jgi:hypothetical protein